MLRLATGSFSFVRFLPPRLATLPQRSHADSGHSDRQSVLDDTIMDGFGEGILLFMVEIYIFFHRLTCSDHHLDHHERPAAYRG